MMPITKFDELTSLIEAWGSSYRANVAPATPAAPIGVRSNVAAATTTAGNLAGGAIRQAITNPNAVANKLAAIRAGGISQAITGAIKGVKDAYAQVRNQQLAHYFDKLDFPAGWPKQGSKFTITDTTNAQWLGSVTSAANIGDKLTLQIDVNKSNGSFSQGNVAAGTGARRYVIELNPKTRAYFSVVSVYVSDSGATPAPGTKNVPTSNYTKNERESDPNYVISYDTQSQSFVLNRNKTYSSLIVANQGVSNLAVGAPIKGVDFVTQRPIEGTVSGPMRQEKDDKGNMINVYPVNANFK